LPNYITEKRIVRNLRTPIPKYWVTPTPRATAARLSPPSLNATNFALDLGSEMYPLA
jgi:hypothetical protein